MAQCNSCIYYVKGKCTNEMGTKFGQDIKNPFENIDCPAYIDTEMEAGFIDDGQLDDMFEI